MKNIIIGILGVAAAIGLYATRKKWLPGAKAAADKAIEIAEKAAAAAAKAAADAAAAKAKADAEQTAKADAAAKAAADVAAKAAAAADAAAKAAADVAAKAAAAQAAAQAAALATAQAITIQTMTMPIRGQLTPAQKTMITNNFNKGLSEGKISLATFKERMIYWGLNPIPASAPVINPYAPPVFIPGGLAGADGESAKHHYFEEEWRP